MTSMAPFRSELRQFQKQHPLFQATHPFWLRCFRGRLSREDLQRWGLDIYPLVRDFPRLYIQTAAKCHDERALTFLAETIFEETGSGRESDSHPTLFRRFLGALGVSENDIPGMSATESGRRIHDFCWQTAVHGSFTEALTLVGVGIERPLPAFFQLIARTLQHRYGLTEAGTHYFAIHTVADVKHSQVASRLVSESVHSPEDAARVRRVLFTLWDLQKQQLDELLAAGS